MNFQKDGEVKSLNELRKMYPNVSFSSNTPIELGWSPYIYPAPTKTQDQIKLELTHAVQMHLDSEAMSRGYDSIISACSYAAAPNIFQAESLALLTWRSDVWNTCYGILNDVLAGQRAIPNAEELRRELPLPPV